MNSAHLIAGTGLRFSIGLATGLAIAAVDNFASGGEVSPIVVVALLLITTFAAGALWSSGAWVASAGVWFCLPASHVVKHVLGFPDTLHPASYRSIIFLAAFTAAVAAAGTGCGLATRRLSRGS